MTALAKTRIRLSSQPGNRIQEAPTCMESELPRQEDAGEDLTIVYQVSGVDGAELSVELGAGASVYDCCQTIARAKGLQAHQVRLIVTGRVEPLTCSRFVNLRWACGGVVELLAVLMKGWALGQAVGPLEACCQATEFQHFSAMSYQEGGNQDVELCQGQQVTMSPGLFKQSGVACGAAFRRLLLPSGEAAAEDCPALAGRVLMRIILHKRSYAFGIGVGTASIDLNKDPEHDSAFYGLYHGGASKNVAARAARICRAPMREDWNDGVRLAILLDVDRRSMQCYEGTEPFGPLFEALPAEPLWPVAVFFRPLDAASVAVDSL